MRCCCCFPNQFVSLERCAAARSPLRHTTHRPAAANSFSSTWENQTWCLYILCASHVDHFFCFSSTERGNARNNNKTKKSVFFFCLFLRVVNSLCKAHASSSEFLLFLTTQQRKNTFSRAHHAYNCKTSPTTSKTHLLLWVRLLCRND